MSTQKPASDRPPDSSTQDSERDEDREKWYHDHRKYLVEGAQYHARALDTHILTLAVGLLAFSTVFMPNEVRSVPWWSGGTLVSAWFLLLVSICCMLVSLYVGRKDYEREIKCIDEQYVKGQIETPLEKGPYRLWVSGLTCISLWSFCLALLSLCIFGLTGVFDF